MRNDFRALCAELTEFVARLTKHYYEPAELLTRARAALADEPAVPQPPAEGEVAELVEWLREQLHVCLQAPWTPGIKHFGRAANLLERLSPLQPVPISERLPGPEDCDAEGRCWWWYPEVPGKTYGYWAHEDDAVPERAFNEQPLHWLPAYALPLPGQEVVG